MVLGMIEVMGMACVSVEVFCVEIEGLAFVKMMVMLIGGGSGSGYACGYSSCI